MVAFHYEGIELQVRLVFLQIRLQKSCLETRISVPVRRDWVCKIRCLGRSTNLHRQVMLRYLAAERHNAAEIPDALEMC